jgi:Periplasmic copper-binding protein (NosD)
MRHRWALTLSIAVAALTFAPQGLATRPVVVDDDHAQCHSAQYTSIQAAVNAAGPGTRIDVCAGTYAEEVLIATAAKNDLRLHARGRRGTVVLDGNNTMMNGFRLEHVTGVLIEGFAVRRYHDDIWLQDADRNEIRGNQTSAAWDHDGIVVTAGSDENNVHHNVSFDNTRPIGCGFSVGGGSRDNRIHHNRTSGNANAGILIGGGLLGPAGPGNVIAFNKVVDNPGHGILNAISGRTRIHHNYVRHNGFRADRPGHGIFLTGAGTTGVVVAYNRVLNSTLDGISLANADANGLVRNHSRANGRDGIRADSASTDNRITRNHMRRNAEHDCHDDSVGGGTGGTANFWLRNHGRTENRPGLCRP